MPLINSDIVAPHWIVADKPVYNQISAWQQIVASKQSYRFYFHENQYDKLDELPLGFRKTHIKK